MIVIRHEEPGRLKIDFSAEQDFGTSSDASELRTGLFVSKADSRSITVEDAGQPAAVVKYVSKVLADLGYVLKVDVKLSETLDKARSEISILEQIKFGQNADITIPSFADLGLLQPLLPHQVNGVAHALRVQNSANFSVPGSGKTRVALAVQRSLRLTALTDNMMVIGPASSFVPWEDEFRVAFGRSPKIIRLIGSPKKRAQLLNGFNDADLVLCTYQMAYRERASLINMLDQSRVFLILDESHHIKNIQPRGWSSAVLELAPHACRRMILSGTPAPHSLKDLWSQFTFLWPSQALLANRAQFEQVLQSSRSPVDDLSKRLRPFFIRTKRSELGLPKPVYRFELIPYRLIPKRQRLIIRLLELKTLNEVRTIGLGLSDLALIRDWRKARIIRLLQASSNPALLNTVSDELGNPGEALDVDPKLANLLKKYEDVEVPAKIAWTLRKVEQLTKQKQKVVVWTSWVKNLRLLEKLLSKFSPLLIFGGVPAYEEDVLPGFESRESNIREFKQRGDRMVLLANPAACSESISLHRECHHAIYLDRTFNCGQFLQSMDRILRVGMPPKTNATYHIPLVQSAIESLVDSRLSERQKVLYALLDEDMPVLGYEEEWSLFERENDVDQIFDELIQEIEKSARQITNRTAKRSRARG